MPLQLDVCPMSWPVGMGGTFEGIYDLARDRLYRPAADATGAYEGDARPAAGLADTALDAILSADGAALLRERPSLPRPLRSLRSGALPRR